MYQFSVLPVSNLWNTLSSLSIAGFQVSCVPGDSIRSLYVFFFSFETSPEVSNPVSGRFSLSFGRGRVFSIVLFGTGERASVLYFSFRFFSHLTLGRLRRLINVGNLIKILLMRVCVKESLFFGELSYADYFFCCFRNRELNGASNCRS